MRTPSFAARLATAAVLITAALAAGGSAATASAPEAAPAEIAVSAPEVFAGFTDNLPFGNNVQVSKKLLIPTGTYTTTAKVVVSGDGSSADVNCRIGTITGGDADESRSTLSSSVRAQTMNLQFNTIINVSQDVISLTCTRNATSTGVVLSWMKIAAIRVTDPSHLHNVPLA